ncbi:MAG: caspase family protein [Desulfobacterales bacterium]|nr:caspase family protein [Desulfobacterales bacterium]
MLWNFYNEQATRENIVFKLNQMQNTNPQDAVLIYLAGHGESLSAERYFIPHELTYPERDEDVRAKGISSDDLSGYIKNIKAQKILLLVDACKSGAVLIAFRGFEDRKALSRRFHGQRVCILWLHLAKTQFAAEVKELGHGVFTYTLLEGLNGKSGGPGGICHGQKADGLCGRAVAPNPQKSIKQEAQYPVVDSRGMDFPLRDCRSKQQMEGFMRKILFFSARYFLYGHASLRRAIHGLRLRKACHLHGR